MHSGKISLTHLAVLLCLAVFAYSTGSAASPQNGLLKVYFFDVGQGDAIFIEAPNGNQVLIDGGPDNKILSRLGEVMSFYDRDIDLMIATHPHADHIAGLIDVLKRYDLKNIIEAKESYDSPEFKAWEEAVKNENANNIEAIAGKVVDLSGGLTLTILHPFESVVGDNPQNPHDDVVVMMLKYGGLKIMLTGDMEQKIERRLILAGESLDSDILKVGHHGSKTSTVEEFLYEISPQIAIIQVGVKNRYGHPSPETLNRLENFGIKYYRTDVDGDIKVVSDGENFKIITDN